jgi:hypothetical protein
MLFTDVGILAVILADERPHGRAILVSGGAVAGHKPHAILSSISIDGL